MAVLDSAQGWILVAVIGCITALFAYFIDIAEASIFDYKEGFCTKVWYWTRAECLPWSKSVRQMADLVAGYTSFRSRQQMDRLRSLHWGLLTLFGVLLPDPAFQDRCAVKHVDSNLR